MATAHIHRRRFLKIAFWFAALFTVAAAMRFAWRLWHFRVHAGEAPQEWMTLGFVSSLHSVDLDALKAELGLPTGVRDRRTLADIAAARGSPVPDFLAEVARAIERLKAKAQ